MVVDIEKIKILNGERPQYVERFDKRTFKSKYQSDLIKGIVEIIKNSVDAYIEEKGEDNCNEEEIRVILDSSSRNPIIEIVNFAEGMDFEKFKEALGVGADTSGDKKGITGAHGYGMKEAAWAFKKTRIISIKKGKFSSRIFYWDENDSPKSTWEPSESGFDLTATPINKEIIEKTRITKEGTYFEAMWPDEIPCPRFDNLSSSLSNNILLRKINQSNKFKIILVYKKHGETRSHPIKYTPPDIYKLREDRDAIDVGEFSFNYPGYGIINCKYEIFLANYELDSTGDEREAGLLICADSFSVLDCTLFDHGDRVSRRFFGSVVLSGPIRAICKKERIIDDKRESGLLKKTPLYENLYNKFHKKLQDLIDKERKRLTKKRGEVSKGVLDNKDELIKEFNKIDRKETEESTGLIGDIKFQLYGATIRFCAPEDNIELIERQEKKIYLIADASQISAGSEIEIKSNKPGIHVSPNKFSISTADIDKNNIFKKKITFESGIIDKFLITAYVKGMLDKAELNIEVIRDRRLHIKNPIEFVPNEQDIVTGKEKKFPLVIDFSRVDKGDKISIKVDKNFSVNKPVRLKDAEKIYENYYELLIPIYCTGKPKQKGEVECGIGGHTTKLQLTIIRSKDRYLRGDFNGIDYDKTDDPDELSYYDNKIIYVCINHPILRHYRRSKEAETGLHYRVLFSDIIIREFCRALARKKVKIFENTDAEDYRVRFNRKFEEFYKKHSARLHKFCIDPKNLDKLMTS